MNNTTYSTGDIRRIKCEVHELVYVVASVLVALVSILVASFLGLHRRLRGNVSANRNSIYNSCCGCDGLRENAVRLLS